jgi:hypothetical protein
VDPTPPDAGAGLWPVLLGLLALLLGGGWAVLLRPRKGGGRPAPSPAVLPPELERERASRTAGQILADKEAARTRARVEAALEDPAGPEPTHPPTGEGGGLAGLVNDRRRRRGEDGR